MSAFERNPCLSDAERCAGMEPERIPAGHIIQREKPEWVMCPAPECAFGLLDYGNSAALEFIKRTLSTRIEQLGIGVRQDLLRELGHVDPRVALARQVERVGLPLGE